MLRLCGYAADFGGEIGGRARSCLLANLMIMLDSAYLAQYIVERSIRAEIVHLESGTPTVAAAAEAVGVQPEQIIKSVLFLAADEPVLVVTNGLTRINRKALADVLDMSRRRIKIAGGEAVAAVTGYAVGAVPPFGHLTPLRTLLEAGVMDQEVVYGGGGESNALMLVSTAELQRVLVPELVDVADR